jgi:hypothetical protein
MYTVKYKQGWFWKTLKGVTGDGLVENRDSRFFMLEDKTLVEIPCHNTIFVFSKERAEMIEQNDKLNKK